MQHIEGKGYYIKTDWLKMVMKSFHELKVIMQKLIALGKLPTGI